VSTSRYLALLEPALIAEPDYYGILDIEPEASSIEVEQAYQQHTRGLDLKAKAETARMIAAERMLSLARAYEVLCDSVQRSHYDIRTFGRTQLPVSDRGRELFREGLKAYRSERVDLALGYFKELIKLYPHRSLYRVHLAIAYADKDWLNFAEAELQTALRLDPEDRFAKETVARVLFKHEEFKREASPPLVKRMSASLRAVVRAATGRLDAPSSTDPLHPNAARPSTRGQDRAPRTRPLE
jgi:tetratricopeptide (TPR) repeat protein